MTDKFNYYNYEAYAEMQPDNGFFDALEYPYTQDLRLMQQLDELLWMYNHLYRLRDKINVFVEVGNYHGASAYVLSKALNKDTHIIMVDSANGDIPRATRDQMIAEGYRVTFIYADSQLEETKYELLKHTQGALIDVIFIDGDHSLVGIKRDFSNWYSAVKDDGLIFIHDIHSEVGDKRVQVYKFWSKLKTKYPKACDAILSETGHRGIGKIDKSKMLELDYEQP